MHLKLIGCEVFKYEIEYLLNQVNNKIDPVYIEIGAHDNTNNLRQRITHEIQLADEADRYEAIILAYGLCGNAISGIRAGHKPLVIPRAHDCCTILLGSRNRFHEFFGHRLCTEWLSTGYIKCGKKHSPQQIIKTVLGMNLDDLINEFGEDNAQYIMDCISPADRNTLIYIDSCKSLSSSCIEIIKNAPEYLNKNLEIIKGDLSLLMNLLSGEWNKKDFLVVPPDMTVNAVYDQVNIFEANADHNIKEVDL